MSSEISVKLLKCTGTLVDIAEAAWVSTLRGTGRSEKEAQIRAIGCMKEGHHVPLEFVDFVFEIRAPLFVLVQLMRYRHAVKSEDGFCDGTSSSAVQQSQRFTGKTKAAFYEWTQGELESFIKEDTLSKEAVRHFLSNLMAKVEEVCLDVEHLMPFLNKRGVECISRLRPQTLMGLVHFKCNLRELLHLFEQRLSPHAQLECFVVASAMYHEVLATPIAPLLEAWAELHGLDLGGAYERA